MDWSVASTIWLSSGIGEIMMLLKCHGAEKDLEIFPMMKGLAWVATFDSARLTTQSLRHATSRLPQQHSQMRLSQSASPLPVNWLNFFTSTTTAVQAASWRYTEARVRLAGEKSRLWPAQCELPYIDAILTSLAQILELEATMYRLYGAHPPPPPPLRYSVTMPNRAAISLQRSDREVSSRKPS